MNNQFEIAPVKADAIITVKSKNFMETNVLDNPATEAESLAVLEQHFGNEPAQQTEPTNVVRPLSALENEIFEQNGLPFVAHEETGKIEMNQLTVAKAFTHQEVMHYDSILKQFNRYDQDSGLWAPESTEMTHKQMAEYLAYLGEDQGYQQFVRRQKVGTINSLIKFAQANDVKPTVADTNGLFHVANGVLNLLDGNPALLPHSSDYPFRKSSLIMYDAQATCPRFQTELLDPALAKEDQLLLQTLFGGMLLGENQAQKILLIRGTPGGGKSTLVTIIEKILGEHKVAYLRAKNLSGRFETAGFIGRSVLVGKDVPGDTLSENGARLLKALTGGDLMEGEIKFQQHRPQMKGNFHVVIVSNNHLRIALDGDDGAWQRRLVTVDFNREIPKKAIVNFAEVLVAEEGPGILNWLIEGAIRYQQQLADGGRIVLTEEQNNRVYNLLYNSDSVRAFIEQHLEVRAGTDTSSTELLMTYITACHEHDWQPVSEKKFLETVADEILKRHSIRRRNDVMRGGTSVRGFKGIAIV